MNKKMKHLIGAMLILIFTLGLTVSANAQEVDAADVTDVEDENFFDKIYTEVSEYAGEILCAMTFVGSLVLALAYKKGLMPIVKSSLLSIGNAMSKMKDSVSENAEKSDELGKNITSGLEITKSVLDGLVNKIDALETALQNRLSDESEAAREKEAMKSVLISQIDMLYDIFMSAALPQYQKDAVAERIAKMKGALEANGTDD